MPEASSVPDFFAAVTAAVRKHGKDQVDRSKFLPNNEIFAGFQLPHEYLTIPWEKVLEAFPAMPRGLTDTAPELRRIDDPQQTAADRAVHDFENQLNRAIDEGVELYRKDNPPPPNPPYAGPGTFVHALRFLSRLTQYVTHDDYRFLTDTARLLKKHESRVVVHHPIYGAGLLKNYVAFMVDSLSPAVLENRTPMSPPDKPSQSSMASWVYNHLPLVLREAAVKPRRPKDFKDLAVHDFLTATLQDDPRDEQNFYFILGADRYLDDTRFQDLLQEILIQAQANYQVIKETILVTKTDRTPDNLKRYVTKVIDPGPTPAEIRETVQQIANHLKRQVPEDFSVYQGLTHYEIEEACSASLIATKNSSKRIDDPETIRWYKAMHGIDPTSTATSTAVSGTAATEPAAAPGQGSSPQS